MEKHFGDELEATYDGYAKASGIVIDTANTTEAPPSDESAALLRHESLPDDRSSFFMQQTQ